MSAGTIYQASCQRRRTKNRRRVHAPEYGQSFWIMLMYSAGVCEVKYLGESAVSVGGLEVGTTESDSGSM